MRFHFITESLPKESKDALEGIAARRENTELRFYSPAKLLSEKETQSIGIALGDSRYAKATYYKFLVADLLPRDIKRVLYIDSDVVCTGNLEELFRLNLGGAPCAMCTERAATWIETYNRLGYPPADGYFNSGIVLINLDIWRKENLRKALFGWLCANAKKCAIQDQDVINACFHGRIFPMDFSYNVYPPSLYVFYWLEEEKNNYLAAKQQYTLKDKWESIRVAVESPRLVHIWGEPKPWHRECAHPFAPVWRYFYAQSPWAAEPLQWRNPQAHTAKAKIKRLGRRALETINLIAPQPPAAIPFPEEAWMSAQRVMDELSFQPSAPSGSALGKSK